VERCKLHTLVESLREIKPATDREPLPPLWVDAAALRLQSLYTGIERCCVLIVRVLNGATPEGGDWHRRLLERMAVATNLIVGIANIVDSKQEIAATTGILFSDPRPAMPPGHSPPSTCSWIPPQKRYGSCSA
jgi:hypothetical protein